MPFALPAGQIYTGGITHGLLLSTSRFLSILLQNVLQNDLHRIAAQNTLRRHRPGEPELVDQGARVLQLVGYTGITHGRDTVLEAVPLITQRVLGQEHLELSLASLPNNPAAETHGRLEIE